MVPAKTLSEVSEQAMELSRHCGISPDLSPEEWLKELRGIEASKLMEIVPKMKNHTFRAVSGKTEFVQDKWFKDVVSGDFPRWCKAEGITVMIGECNNEESVYALVNSPSGPDYAATLHQQLCCYYPRDAVDDLLRCYDVPSASSNAIDWANVFGLAVSDSQVYASERLFIRYLVQAGVSVLRYQIKYRPAFLDRYTPRAMGVSHTFDDSLWWFCTRALLEPEELSSIQREKLLSTYRQWLSGFASFVAGEESLPTQWYGRHPIEDVADGRVVRQLGADMAIRVVHDERWAEKESVNKCLQKIVERAAAAASI
jgi:carboxylesterase type B